MNRAVLVAACLLAAACGGATASPTSSPPHVTVMHQGGGPVPEWASLQAVLDGWRADRHGGKVSVDEAYQALVGWADSERSNTPQSAQGDLASFRDAASRDDRVALQKAAEALANDLGHPRPSAIDDDFNG